MLSRRTNLQIVEDKREELKLAIQRNNTVINTLAAGQQDRFRKNFLEFASQDYLLNTINTKEIIRFAVNITKLGLDIAPSSNEVYIIPFDTKN
jgi:recombinational DNA repair protein RecT